MYLYMNHVMRKPVFFAICEQQRRISAVWSAPLLFAAYIQTFKPLPSFCGCADWFESTLVANPEDRVSRDEAQMISVTILTFSLFLNFELVWSSSKAGVR